MIHLCKTCIESFAECNGKPIFSIDRDPSLRSVEADMVVECDQYNGPDKKMIEHIEHGGWKCDFCGYDGQDNQQYNQFCAWCHVHR